MGRSPGPGAAVGCPEVDRRTRTCICEAVGGMFMVEQDIGAMSSCLGVSVGAKG